MKANKAPKYLYVDTNDRLSDSILYGFTKKQKDDDIEYTRTDVFIEKAVGRLIHYLDNSVWVSNDVGVREKEAIIADFVNYLKGE